MWFDFWIQTFCVVAPSYCNRKSSQEEILHALKVGCKNSQQNTRQTVQTCKCKVTCNVLNLLSMCPWREYCVSWCFVTSICWLWTSQDYGRHFQSACALLSHTQTSYSTENKLKVLSHAIYKWTKYNKRHAVCQRYIQVKISPNRMKWTSNHKGFANLKWDTSLLTQGGIFDVKNFGPELMAHGPKAPILHFCIQKWYRKALLLSKALLMLKALSDITFAIKSAFDTKSDIGSLRSEEWYHHFPINDFCVQYKLKHP